MTEGTSMLQALRQERHPLAALAALSLVVRLCLIMLGTALSPDSLAASGLGVYCQSAQPTGKSGGAPAAQHGLICTCGTVCPHGCAAPLSGASDNAIGVNTPAETAVSRILISKRSASALQQTYRAIRAPPPSLS